MMIIFIVGNDAMLLVWTNRGIPREWAPHSKHQTVYNNIAIETKFKMYFSWNIVFRDCVLLLDRNQ